MRAKELFLTHARCGLDLNEAFKQLQAKVLIDHYLLKHEKYEDGGVHIHAFLRLNKLCDIKNVNRLDIKNSNNKIHYGNYIRARSSTAVIGDCLKEIEDGSVLTNLQLTEDGTEKTKEALLIEILKSEGQYKAYTWLESILEPDEFFKKPPRYKKFVDVYLKTCQVLTNVPEESFNEHPEIVRSFERAKKD